jgi:acyl-CoA thioester hydrolase
MDRLGMIEIETRVRMAETDLMQVAHHANYFRWFEMARVEYLRARGVVLKDLVDMGILFPIKDVHCNYIESARYDDELLIRAQLVQFSKVKIVFTYQILRKQDGAVLAEGETTNVFTGPSGKIARLPDAIFHQLRQ